MRLYSIILLFPLLVAPPSLREVEEAREGNIEVRIFCDAGRIILVEAKDIDDAINYTANAMAHFRSDGEKYNKLEFSYNITKAEKVKADLFIHNLQVMGCL